MSKQEQIATYYTNARELVKQNNPKAARAYVLLILNEAVKTYESTTTILAKAKTAAFLDKWIAVARELYTNGITVYVLDCFGLTAANGASPCSGSSKQNKIRNEIKPSKVKKEGNPSAANDSEIDFSGLIDEASKTQGWCAEIFDVNKSAVVEISVSGSLRKSNGTGFIISDNGYLLTNDHVVFDSESGVFHSKVTMSLSRDKKSYKIEPLFSDKKTDVALCRFNPNEVQSFSSVKRIADYSHLKQGADCLVIGNAFGMGLAPFTGIVRFTKNNSGNLVYTAPSNPGDSGGPVFNRSGECIGINKSKTVAVNGTTADGYANATPMDEIDHLLQKWAGSNSITL